MINWKVRFANENFWLGFIPAVGLLLSLILDLFGVQFDANGIVTKLLGIVKALFAVLAIVGIVNDPTTNGLSDSERALRYEQPWNDHPDLED